MMARKHGKWSLETRLKEARSQQTKSTVHLVQDSDEESSTTAVITAAPTAGDEEKLKMSVGPGESPPQRCRCFW